RAPPARNETINPSLFQLMYFYFGVLMYFRSGVDSDAVPSVIVDVMNVWDERLPEFDNAAIDAKYKGVAGSAMNEAETRVWNRIQELVARFKQADGIVVGVPMWNFAYPYKRRQSVFEAYST